MPAVGELGREPFAKTRQSETSNARAYTFDMKTLAAHRLRLLASVALSALCSACWVTDQDRATWEANGGWSTPLWGGSDVVSRDSFPERASRRLTRQPRKGPDV